MKKLVTIIAVLAFMTNIKAQDYVPFPTSAVWSEYFNAPISTSLTSYYYRNILTEKDTVVGANTYHQLFWSYSDTAYIDSPTVLYKGGIREYNQQVFFLPKDSVHEYLLYDFSLELGDTIDYKYSKFASGYGLMMVDTLIVSTIDSVQIEDGTYRKRIEFSGFFGNYLIPIHWANWIEGVGSQMGLLVPIGDIPTNALNYVLGCLKVNNEVIYHDAFFQTCFPITESISVYDLQNKMDIFPNPFHQYTNLKLNGNSQISGFKVINSLGQVVLQKAIIPNTTEEVLDLSLLPNGIYFLLINGDKGVSQSVKLIKY